MPLPKAVREEVLVRSRRTCCVCHRFGGRNVEVHHIVPEADGGPDTIENAIALCFRCHAEAGHYNPRHPRGTAYSPSELRKHRDAWWSYCANDFSEEDKPLGYNEEAGSGRGRSVHRKKVGVLWSHLANIDANVEAVEFEGKLVTGVNHETVSDVTFAELYELSKEEFLVYRKVIHRGDWCSAHLHGAGTADEPEVALSLTEVQDMFPELATAAGVYRVRRLE